MREINWAVVVVPLLAFCTLLFFLALLSILLTWFLIPPILFTGLQTVFGISFLALHFLATSLAHPILTFSTPGLAFQPLMLTNCVTVSSLFCLLHCKERPPDSGLGTPIWVNIITPK